MDCRCDALGAPLPQPNAPLGRRLARLVPHSLSAEPERRMQPNILANLALAAEGQRKIDWVGRNMPILRQLEQRFAAERPFAGCRVAVCIHLEAKTAYLALVLRAGGAAVAVTGSNPESTKDDVVAALAAQGLHVYARHGASAEEMRNHMGVALTIEPHVVIDDGGDLVELLHESHRAHGEHML